MNTKTDKNVDNSVNSSVNNSVNNSADKNATEDAVPVQALEETPWGEIPADNFGYASDEERRAKRGLEDWEMIDAIPDAQLPVPRWFIAIIVAVVLVAVGLSFPFWGDRPGYEREWINWGFGVALLYIAVFGTFVYFMVNFYGSKVAGRLDHDKLSDKYKDVKSSKNINTSVNDLEVKNNSGADNDSDAKKTNSNN